MILNISIEIYKEGQMYGYLIKTDIKNSERLNLSGFSSYFSIAGAVAQRIKKIIEEGKDNG